MDSAFQFDWGSLTLLSYIVMRMTGLVLFNPLIGRSGVPNDLKAGFILVLSFMVFSLEGGSVVIPESNFQYMFKLVMEVFFGFFVSTIMALFFSIPVTAGQYIDAQMGFSMAQNYDPATGANMTVSSTMLNIMMILIFLAANGHHTMFTILMTTGEMVPYGGYWFGENILNYMVLILVECMVLAVKISMPVIAAELLCQVGMGALMKAIPQINVFAINIDLKIIIGLFLYLALLDPMSLLMLEIEKDMLDHMRQMLIYAGENARA
ncbi:MAG: flagellar biosynthetic protein FliR [Eubacteriales bacterium]